MSQFAFSLRVLAPNQPRRGLQLIGAAETLRDDTGHRRRPVECRWLDESRAEAVRLIGAEAVADALAEGRAMPLEAAVGNALDACRSIAQPAASPSLTAGLPTLCDGKPRASADRRC